ncbi:PilW family protein [Candidatus Venteria ishoeyi]|uniref:Type IV pilus assembly protein PilW n=2 Tax=Candidatus Venteria ishoeyi TaxID=1899563 RepID=A0A1H6FAL5_9GAMM|nr:PilW family protein [Candidatus Venteria ishoeyi]SEH07150.1 Uncharacterised protein [Candidatus Venteria ishoeyi]
MNASIQKQQGLSLIEILIAMVISLVLLAGVVNIMRSSKYAYNTQTDLSQLQQSARIALSILGKDLRMVGYFGCSSVPPSNTPADFQILAGRDDEGAAANHSDVLRLSFLETGQNAFSIMHCPPYEPYGKDLVSFGGNTPYDSIDKYEDDCSPIRDGAPLTETPFRVGRGSSTDKLKYTEVGHDDARFAYPGSGDIDVDDQVVVSDCGSGQIYTVNSLTGGMELELLGSGSSGLIRTYDNKGMSYGAELRRINTYRYFVGSIIENGETRFSLCRDQQALGATLSCSINAQDNGDVEELIEGVESMQLLYAVNTAAVGVPFSVRYLTATEIDTLNLWNKVQAVRVSLLMRTLDERFNALEPDTNTYNNLDPQFADDGYGPPNDHRLRRLVSTTIKLRNWGQ